MRGAHSDSNSDCHAYGDCYIHSNGDSNRYSHPDAYTNAMHGKMCTDTEASPNPAPASNTARMSGNSSIEF